MAEEKTGWTDEQVEQFLGNLLRGGVLLAAAVVLFGGVLYLVRHGDAPAPDHRVFRGVPAQMRSPEGILDQVLEFQSEGIIQLGVLLLIATPVARVVFSVIAFARQRDHTYVVITLIVLAVLLFSLFSGHAG
jgi:uncharacterized membrane protein